MDSAPSENVTNILTTTTSRREALKVLTTTTVGGSLALNAAGMAFLSPRTPQTSHPITLRNDRADHIIAIAQGAMKQYDLHAVILSVSIGKQNVVTTALGQSITGV